MDLLRIGRALRAIRVRRGWRQADLARRAAVSPATIGRIERGDAGTSVRALLAVAEAADLRLEVRLSWRGAGLDRMLGRRHARMHELMASCLRERAGWEWASEVSFSIYGERGVIDVLAFHPRSKALLIIELKTQLVDVQELLGVMDRRGRLAMRIAAERGWAARSVSRWVVLADSSTNRRRLAAHAAVLRHAFPADGRAMRRWLSAPTNPVSALSFLSDAHGAGANDGIAPIQRIRRRSARSAAPVIARGEAWLR